MLIIGSHISFSKGYEDMGKQAVELGANTFAFFTRNPRGGSIKALDVKDAKRFVEFAKENNFGKIVAHAPYTMNPCAQKEELRKFAKEAMAEDLSRMENIPGNYYNFHPGSHVGQGEKIGIEYIAELLNEVLKSDQSTTVLLETMAGKGTEIGKSFEQIQQILEKVELQDKIGVCMDTCHIWDAGYDIVEDLDGVLKQFDEIIGLYRLKAVHLNDSMNVRGSKKDRHAKIGEGMIGKETLVSVINHPLLKGLPFILETPNEIEGWKKEIKMLKEEYKEK
ncbi:MAG: deoxyribonuclease IV [Lachnospiraceae bacterium]|nr:deoxyribonuclease IV [Lachnospiraceae bacterium]